MECTRRTDELPDRAMLHVSVQQAPFGSSDRRVTNASTDRRFLEYAHYLKCALEATILLQLYPRSRMEVAVVILADDGGRLCAAMNAATLALVDAGISMKDLLCACSAGLNSTTSGLDDNTIAMVDLNRREESSNHGEPAVYLPCAMLPQRGTIVLAQCEARLPNWMVMEQVLEAAMEGCRAVFDIMQAAIRERASSLLAARNGQALITTTATTTTIVGSGSEST
jgi:exosome complex component RRP41